jgi:hypothetical protein
MEQHHRISFLFDIITYNNFIFKDLDSVNHIIWLQLKRVIAEDVYAALKLIRLS